jgi:DNA helicase-2/ATP-dependent DNA helicase PcrA
VDALRRQLRDQRAASGTYHIDTIAGWALRYAIAFPKTAGCQAGFRPSGDEWQEISRAAARALISRHVKDIVRLSYSGVLVDEYQDCTTAQHELVLALADVLPCRILGDPLQGIFDFADSSLVDWQRDVLPHFTALPELDYPWRWHNDLDFGRWLLAVRPQFQTGGPIDLSKAPVGYVKWCPSGDSEHSFAQRAACKDAADRLPGGESAVAILDWAARCHKLVRSLGPRYSIVEPIDCPDLTAACHELATRTGLDRVDVVVKFAGACLTQVKGELKPVVTALRSGRTRRTAKCQEQSEALARVASEESLSSVLSALEAIRRISNAQFVRRELFYEMCRSLEAYAGGGHETLKDAAWHVRNRTSRTGRRYGRMIVSRTVLVKGLEFDHAIVLDADAMDAHDLYVAMTRGARSLTVVSKSRILRPKMPGKNTDAVAGGDDFRLVPC